MRFILRADASETFGSGHIMRCIGIIEELISRNLCVIFIGNTSQVEWIGSIVNSTGFEYVYDCEKKFNPNRETDILILDSYSIPVDHDFINRNNWKYTIAIVDNYTPDYIVDLKIFPSFIDELNHDSNSEILSGSSYIPLRKSIRKIQPVRSNSELSIVVTGGGVDQHNFAVAVANELANYSMDFSLSIFTNRSELLKTDNRFKVYKIGGELDSVANSCSLALTTASSSAVEFIARGCAVGIGCSHDNQLHYYHNFSFMGLAKPIGILQYGNWLLNKTNLSLLLNSKQLRLDLTKKCIELVDFWGAKRIVEKILFNVQA